MLNKLKELRESREEGFTLIELLVVIVIIGVLAAIALPIFLNQQKAAQAAAVKSDVRNTVSAVATALVKSPTATAGIIKTAADAAGGSAGVTTTAAGAWDQYMVYGWSSALGTTVAPGVPATFAAGNGAVPTGTYAFNSMDGKYYDKLPA